MILLQRYIFAGLVKTTFAVVTIVVGVACIARSLAFMDYIINHGLSVAVYFYIMLLITPMLLMGLLPIAGFVSVMFVYAKLGIDNELIVMRAAGMSIASLAKPAIVLAGATMLTCLSVTVYFMPLSFAEFKDMEFFMQTRMASMVVKEGEFNRLAPKITIYIRERTRNGEITGVLVQDDRDPVRSKTLMAERAAFVQTGEISKVLLQTGNMQEFDRRTRKVSVVYFDKHIMEIDMRELDSGGIRERGIAERGILELLDPPTSTPRDRELAGRARAEGHQRIAFPILCVSYIAIALASLLAGPFDRRGAPWRIAAACGAVVGIQAMHMFLASAASLAPMLLPAIHLNAVLPGIFCVFLLAYYDRHVSTGRLAFWHRRGMPVPLVDGSVSQ